MCSTGCPTDPTDRPEWADRVRHSRMPREPDVPPNEATAHGLPWLVCMTDQED